MMKWSGKEWNRFGLLWSGLVLLWFVGRYLKLPNQMVAARERGASYKGVPLRKLDS